jgi:CRISPR-associated endonuclease/helicase Cas3
LCSAFDLENEHNLLRKAQRFSINLFAHQFDNLLKTGAIHEVQSGTGIYCLSKQYYSEEFGWSNEPVGDMEIHIV